LSCGESRQNLRQFLRKSCLTIAKAVQDGASRLDLYYRLNIIKIALPALRERKEDIVELASHFVKHYREAFKKSIDFLPSRIIDQLLDHSWPGNVRELENVIQRAVLMAKGNVITEKDLIFDVNPSKAGNGDGDYFGDLISAMPNRSLKEILAKFEGDVISHMLAENNPNRKMVLQRNPNFLSAEWLEHGGRLARDNL